MQYHAEPNRSAPEDNNSQVLMARKMRVSECQGKVRAAESYAAKWSQNPQAQADLRKAKDDLHEAHQRLAALGE